MWRAATASVASAWLVGARTLFLMLLLLAVLALSALRLLALRDPLLVAAAAGVAASSASPVSAAWRGVLRLRLGSSSSSVFHPPVENN